MNRSDLKRLIRRHFSSIVVVAIILAIFIVGFGSSILEIIRLSELKVRLKSEIAQGQEEINQLNEDKKQIGKQPYVERIARTYLGLYYPNELIVVPVESKPVNTDKTQEQTPETQEETQEVIETETAPVDEAAEDVPQEIETETPEDASQ